MLYSSFSFDRHQITANVYGSISNICKLNLKCLMQLISPYLKDLFHTKFKSIFPITCYLCIKGKGKAHPLQAMHAQRNLGELRLLNFLTSALYGGRLSASCTGRLYPQGHPWYSFSRGAESTAGPWFSRKEICHWKIQWHDRESIPGPSD
jgi:hypothetical protein